MKNVEQEISVVDFKIVIATSKKGKKYTCLVAIDENDKEYFVSFVK